MATWKERGEVPDSEDEFAYDDDDGDDQLELPPLPAGAPAKHIGPTLLSTAREVWDIPASSLERNIAPPTTDPTRPGTPTKEPYFALLSSPLSDPPSDVSSVPGSPPAPEPRKVRLAKARARQFSPDPLANDDEPPARFKPGPLARLKPRPQARSKPDTPTISTSIPPASSKPESPVRSGPESPTAPEPEPPTRLEVEPPTRFEPEPPAEPSPESKPESEAAGTPPLENTNRGTREEAESLGLRQQEDEDDGLSVSSIFGTRGALENPTRDNTPSATPSLIENLEEPGLRVRTFRPRKPIQEHPYALENARYSNTFRSHGLKPLRLEANPESNARRRAVEEDSQEKEFQDDSQENGDVDDETQESIHDPLLNISGEIQPDTQFDDWDIHRPSLPSTPTTSLPQHRGGPSSILGSAESDRTSVDGEAHNDEFPPLEELVKEPIGQTSSKSSKRKTPLTFSPRHKRLKSLKSRQPDVHQENSALEGVRRSTPSRPSPSSHEQRPTPLLPRLIFPDDITPSPPSPSKIQEDSRFPDPSPPVPSATRESESPRAAPVDLTAEPDSDSEDESTDAEPEPEPRDHAAIKKAARRLRGVLPPSYLRLGETDGNKARRGSDPSRNPIGSPELQRKGLARRRTSGGTAPSTGLEVFQDSDEDSPNEVLPPIDDGPPPMLQRTLVIETDDDDDDGSSAMEDNRVDQMLPTKKRQSSGSGNSRPAKRMKPTGRPALHATQPKITSHFSGGDGKPSQAPSKAGTKPKHRKRRTGLPNSRNKKTSRKKRVPVPRLSILDVIEPDAPKFLKVAARSARQRVDMGRSSPSKKIFQMATRWDHVEVNTVLQKWKGGHLKPRLAPDARPRRPKPKNQVPSAPRPAGTAAKQWPITKQKKLVKQVGTSGRVTYEASSEANPSTAPTPFQERDRTPSARLDRPLYRPAQLETTSTELARHSFHTKKRALDSLWRNSLRGPQSMTPSAVGSARMEGRASRSPSPPPADCIQTSTTESTARAAPSSHKRPKSKFRKNFNPKSVDVSAPQFSAADEPLPAPTMPTSEDSFEIADPLPEANKLSGLSPFGFQYTHHFEIFPLDSDVFFHESTLLGSGRIDKATDNWDNERLSLPRPRVSFTLDGKLLRWGAWDEQVSSELGILIDWLADNLPGDHGAPDSPHGPTALQASDFVLSYIQDSMSLPDESAEQSFAYRILETMKSFLERFKDNHHFEARAKTGTIDVLCRILVAVFTCNHICRKSPALVDVRMPMEDLLLGVSRVTTGALLSHGTDDVRTFLEDSRQLSYRQRGVRPRQVVIHTWVVLMRVLEIASIPRSGFWDVVNSVMIPQNLGSETRLESMEKLWKTMFTLLPLREFDSQGVVVPGIRRLVSMDGWGLPQRLIKRVFELYKLNHRQSASFNDYCRALLSRCHYLAREWGWSNCRGIIGAIFDFFGSQHLSHLRNEEAFKSPRFLDELAGNPSLVIEREDRCFHIFLKFVALTITRLRDREATNEIRNLIARIIPNHSRYYLKEQPLHSHDLASLRNHHDLLCTLFWAAPRDLRPDVHLIEALIRPADTHKDACIVNLRAWNQLVRYVVSTEDDEGIFRVFHQWQCNIFRQLMDQFSTAASDAQQQFLALSEEDSQGISQTRIEYVVSVNKATAKEIILACVNASRDVLPYARSIPAATFALNTLQVREIFSHFSISPPTLDWAILRSTLETLNAYLIKADSFCQRQPNWGPGGDDCMSQVMSRLHHELSTSLFSAARCVIATEGNTPKGAIAVMAKSVCVELITFLSASLFAGFSKAGLVNISQALGPGQYGLFGKQPHKLPLGHRKYLVLFVAVLLKRGLPQVDALGPSLLEVWLLAIVKPRQFLAYEHQLAEELKHRNESFVPEAVVSLSINPDYGSNRDLFECKTRIPVKAMRSELSS